MSALIKEMIIAATDSGVGVLQDGFSRSDLASGVQAGSMPASQTILLIEDESFVSDVVVDVLKLAGYTVLTAANAAEGRQIYEQFREEIDLLISDVVLPDENGCMLARRIKTENRELAVLLVTGYADQVGTVQNAGGMEWLAKPFSARTLLEKVRSLLKNRCLHRSDLLTCACGTA